MTELPCLDAIDFSQRNDAYSFKFDVWYQLIKCLVSCIHNETPGWNPIYLRSIYLRSAYPKLHELIEVTPEYSQQELEAWLGTYFRHCVQYKQTIFCFTDYGCGIYYSIENKHWRVFRWKSFFPYCYYHLDESLGNLDDFFISQAKTVTQKEIPLIEDPAKFSNYMSETDKPIEFVCGSESELKKLVRLVAITLPGLQIFLKKSSKLSIFYASKNEDHIGGAFPLVDLNYPYYYPLCKQGKQLFDLIYEYNFFTGLYWQKSMHSINSIPAEYADYYPQSYMLNIEIKI